MSSKSQMVLALCPVNAELKHPSDIRIGIAVVLGTPTIVFVKCAGEGPWVPLEWLQRPISGLC